MLISKHLVRPWIHFVTNNTCYFKPQVTLHKYINHYWLAKPDCSVRRSSCLCWKGPGFDSGSGRCKVTTKPKRTCFVNTMRRKQELWLADQPRHGYKELPHLLPSWTVMELSVLTLAWTRYGWLDCLSNLVQVAPSTSYHHYLGVIYSILYLGFQVCDIRLT